MSLKVLAAAAALFLSVACAEAKTFGEMFPGRTYEHQEAQKFVESLDYGDGAIALGTGGVQLNVPRGFYFLSAEHARRVIVDAWSNPPTAAEKVLGMIMPSDKTPLDDAWGAVITYDEDGYVSDEDAARIDYNALLKDMQEGTAQASEERVKQGFPAIRLVGWASPPFYDRATHKLHWAKELEFGDQPKHTLELRRARAWPQGRAQDQLRGRHGPARRDQGRHPGRHGHAGVRGRVALRGLRAGRGQGGRLRHRRPDRRQAAGKAGVLAIALVFLKKGWILVVLALARVLAGCRTLFRGRRQHEAPRGVPVRR